MIECVPLISRFIVTLMQSKTVSTDGTEAHLLRGKWTDSVPSIFAVDNTED